MQEMLSPIPSCGCWGSAHLPILAHSQARGQYVRESFGAVRVAVSGGRVIDCFEFHLRQWFRKCVQPVSRVLEAGVSARDGIEAHRGGEILVKVGFIGAGVIAKAHIACMKAAVPEAEIVGVSDIDCERAASVGEEFGISSFATNKALFEAGTDAVFVCTYPKAHKECVLEALDADNHVFCEKPLAPTLPEGLEIAQAVRKSNKKFMIGYLFHFSTAVKRIRSLLDSGDLGELALAWSLRYAYFVPPASSWLADPVGGGILDVCTHDIEFLSWLGGKPRAVVASGLTAHPGLQCLDTASITMTFEQGIGTVVASWASPLNVMHIGVAGNKGAAAIIQEDGKFTLAIKLRDRDQINEAGEDLSGVVAAEQRHFIDAVYKDDPVAVGIDDALRALEIHQAVETSWKTGQSVTLKNA